MPFITNRRGRPPHEPAELCRNKIFGFAARYLTGHKKTDWFHLDAELLGEKATRDRIFYRISKYGHDPNSASIIEKKRDGSLMSVLQKRSTLKPCILPLLDNFHSILWKMLTPPGLSLEVMQSQVPGLLDKLNLFQATEMEARIGAREQPNELAWQFISDRKNPWAWTGARITPTPKKKLNAFSLREQLPASIDCVALLCIQFRVATDALDLKLAEFYLLQLPVVLHRTCRVLHLPESVSNDLSDLISTRLLRNDWISHWKRPTFEWDVGLIPKEKASYTQEDFWNMLVENIFYETLEIPSRRDDVWPIIPATPYLKSFRDNRHVLLIKLMQARAPNMLNSASVNAAKKMTGKTKRQLMQELHQRIADLGPDGLERLWEKKMRLAVQIDAMGQGRLPPYAPILSRLK